MRPLWKADENTGEGGGGRGREGGDVAKNARKREGVHLLSAETAAREGNTGNPLKTRLDRMNLNGQEAWSFRNEDCGVGIDETGVN